MTVECTPMPAGRGGWSEWTQPIMRGYLMQCCDCGLVHELQFRVLEQTGPANDLGEWPARPLQAGRVEFRARRHKSKKSKR